MRLQSIRQAYNLVAELASCFPDCGYISASIGWRWIEWIHMIANGALLIVEFFFLKETRGAKILMDRAKALCVYNLLFHSMTADIAFIITSSRKETGDNR